MDHLFTKPLKRFLYTTWEFKNKHSRNNLNSVQYSTDSDEAVFAMTELKSIIRMSPKSNATTKLSQTKQIIKNNVLFNDSIETISSDNTQNLALNSNLETDEIQNNNNNTKLFTVKIIEKPIIHTATLLNLTNKSDSISVSNQEKSHPDENVNTQTPVIKIKVKVIKDAVTKNDNENNLISESRKVSFESSNNKLELELEKQNITTDKNESISTIDNQIISDNITGFENLELEKQVMINDKDESISATENQINSENNKSLVDRKPSVSDFDDLTPEKETIHNVEKSCIFVENKSRPLSPIPVSSPPTPFKFEKYNGVNNLIEFHERQVHKINNKTLAKTLPRMGTSSLVNNRSPESKSQLNDSEIISQLVKDRFIVNMYESRNCQSSFVKKSTYGRIYKSLEHSVELNKKNDFITKENVKNWNKEIVTIKQSSPIKLEDQVVSLNTNISFDKPKIVAKTSSNNSLNEIDFQNAVTSEYGSSSIKNSTSTLSQDQELDRTLENYSNNADDTEMSSYNMEEFLRKALGDEMNNCDNTETELEEKEVIPEPIEENPQEESISTSNASDLISKINTFQSSVYRTFAKKLQHMTGTLKHPSEQKHEKESICTDFESSFESNEQVTALLQQAAVQYETLKQITKALTLCKNSKEFSISSEQVEGERLLLVATHKRQAILDEIRRLEYEQEELSSSIETGTLIISGVTLSLKEISDDQPGRHEQKWYVCIFSCGPQVVATQPMSARMDKCVKFAEEITFRNLSSDFIINLEVYCLMQKRVGRNFSHESKYHLNKSVKKSHCPSPKKYLSREKSSLKLSTRLETGIRKSSFKLCGSLKISVGDLPKSGPWDLRGKIPQFSILTGSISLQLQSRVQIPINQSGFLTIASEAGGHTVWNRRWCVLAENIIKYWNYPSEEESCIPLREIDLKYCVSSVIKIADRSICAKPRTLLLETARPPKANDSDSMMVSFVGSYTVEKHYFSADNAADLNIWQTKLNNVIRALQIWNVGYLS